MKRRGLALAVLLSLVSYVPCAWAQMSEGERKAAARAAYMEGVELQDKGKPLDALGRFEAAEKLFDAPTHLLHIAQCQVVTGKLVEAAETYETLAHKSFPEGSPEVFVQAQQQGATEAAALKTRIPTLRIKTTPEPQKLQNVQIIVNDKQLPAELLGIARPVNPGKYRIDAVASGWHAQEPALLDLNEKENREVTITLVEGQTAPVPPPYEQGKPPPPKEGPSNAGLLVGLRPTWLFPVGDVANKIAFKDYASSGPGVGIDVLARFARVVLAGATLEVSSLGAPNDRAFAAGTSVDVSTHMLYFGGVFGVNTNIDKIAFVADATLGFRSLSRTLTVTTIASGASQDLDESYKGLEYGINLGVSFPVNTIRIVPKMGFSTGSFGSRSCDAGALGSTLTGCATNSTVDTGGHTILNLSLGIYYHADFSKKASR